MGNKLGRRRHAVDERYTRPQGLYVHKDVDHKKLRKLILESKLAPCYPGDDECCCDLEECPICFLFYPSLNRSRCCLKGICTECFLQMKNPNSTRPTQCPFCKTSNYAVEYQGSKTKEEKGLEQIEEQRVIEAKIRMRQQEIQDEEERMQKKLGFCSSSANVALGEIEQTSVAAAPSSEISYCQDSSAGHDFSQLPHPRSNRNNGIDLDLEDIMVMEAIWLSVQHLQDNARQGIPAYCDMNTSESSQHISGHYVSTALAPIAVSSSSSPSGGLACELAALAEHQQMDEGDTSINHNQNLQSLNMVPPSTSRFYNDSYVDMSHNRGMVITRDNDEWGVDHGSEVAEAGTSYASSDGAEDTNNATLRANGGTGIPETFEEQMMLAMAVSLNESRAMTSGTEAAWQ